MRRAIGLALIIPRSSPSPSSACASASPSAGCGRASPSSLSSVLPGASSGGSGAATASASSSLGGGAASASAAGALPSSGGCSPSAPTYAIGAPTSTTSPGSARNFRSVPPACASISIVALSVSISAITSPLLTVSPTALVQLTKVPSAMSKPSLGMVSVSATDDLLDRLDDLLWTRQSRALDVRGVGQRLIHRRHTLHRRVHIVEHFVLQPRSDLRPDVEHRQAFLDHDAAIRLLEALEHRLQIERAQPAQVNDLGLNAVLRQRLRRRGGPFQPLAEGHDRHVVALALDVALADRQHEVRIIGDLRAPLEHGAVLDEQNRVVVTDRRLEHALRVVGRAGHRHVQTGEVREDHLGRVGVCRAELLAAAGRGADHQRNGELTIEHIAHFGGVVDDRVQRQKREVDRHDLRDGSQPGHRRADRRTRNHHLSDRGVAHAFLAELVQKAARHGVRAAPDADLFAQDEDALVALHFLAQGRAKRLANGNRFVCHSAPQSTYTWLTKSSKVGSGLFLANSTASSTSSSTRASISSSFGSMFLYFSISSLRKRPIGPLATNSSTSSLVR